MSSEPTKTDDAQLGDGEVQITISGKEYVLKPYFSAARTISSKYGGIMGAIERVMRLEVDVIVDVICLGTGHGSGRRPSNEFQEGIWREGFTDDTGGLAERCVQYLRALSSGGRTPKDAQEGDDDGSHPPKG